MGNIRIYRCRSCLPKGGCREGLWCSVGRGQGLVVTRDDVASRAGTSSAVVSYVVNGGPRSVSPATRARVLKAINELGYRPNGLARALRTQKTFTIGLIVPDNTNPFFAQLARAVEEAAFERGYVLLLGNSAQDNQRQAQYVRTFLERQVDGLVLIADFDARPFSLRAETAQALRQAGTPFVLLDRHPDDLWAPSVTVDNEGGGYLATRHLLEHGHKAIACLAGPSEVRTANQRAEGWARALDEAGVARRREWVVRSRFRRRDGYLAARALFSQRTRPRALFAHSDEQAIGALHAAHEAGIQVPDDVAIVSFDGTDEAAYTIPPLSTVAQPVEELGRCTVDMLISGEANRRKPRCLPVHLVARRSCGCCSEAAAPTGT